MPKPIIIRVGDVRVKIYSGKDRGKMRYEVRDHFGGETNRTRFTCKQEALTYGNLIAVRMANGESAKFRLTDLQAYQAEEATDLLKRKGIDKTLIEVVIDYADRWEMATKQRLADSPLVSKVVEEFLAEKWRQQLSAYHQRDLKIRLGRFAADFKLPINRILHSELGLWLNGLKVKARTWNNYRAALASLFKFAKERKHLPAEWAELEVLQPIHMKPRTVQLFTPDEMGLLLTECKPSFLPVLALGAFAGLRSEEIQRIKWADFKWDWSREKDRGHILLRSEITKTSRTRTVPILPNLAEWLRPWSERSDRVCDYADPSKAKCMLAQRLGLTWGRNALRHSYISYRLALLQDIAQVALEAGNSPSVIHKSYLELVTPKEALKWFEIRPKTVTQNILPLEFGH